MDNPDKWYISGPLGIGTPDPKATLSVSGAPSTTQIETSTVLHLLRPVVPTIKNDNSVGLSVGAFEEGITGRARLDIKLSGPPQASNEWGRIPDVSVMTLRADGNVGIGTTDPKANLSVSGAPSTTQIETNTVLHLLRPVVPTIKNDNSVGLAVGAFEEGPSGRARLDIKLSGTPQASNEWGRIPDVTVMTLRADGNVGIGTTAPDAPLEVQGGTKGKFQIGRGNLAFEGGNEGGNLHIESREGMYLNFYSNKPIFFGTGNVGIGTTNLTSKLHVAGNAGILSLEGTDHAYIQWYPVGLANGRKAWIGYGEPGNTSFTIRNDADAGRMHIYGTELLYLLNKNGVIVGKGWGGNGNLSVEGDLSLNGRFNKLDVAEGDKYARIRAHDLLLGHSSRGKKGQPPSHGHPDTRDTIGRALVDQPRTIRVPSPTNPRVTVDRNVQALIINFGSDWDAVIIEGIVQTPSSKTIKEDIRVLSSQTARRIVSDLVPVWFTYKGKSPKIECLGFIAEDSPPEVSLPGSNALVMNHVIAALTSVVKDQVQAISELQAQVNLLANKDAVTEAR